MKGSHWSELESWCWRGVMPALIAGGNAAGIVLLLAALFRSFGWLTTRRGERWSWRKPAFWWLGYFGLQVLGGAWSEDLEAWRWSLEVKSALWFMPVVMAVPGRNVAREFWWSVGWSMALYLSWRMLRAGWFQWVLDQPGEWQYARFSGDVHPTYLGLHTTVAALGLGDKWGGRLPNWGRWSLWLMFGTALGLMGSKAGVLAAAGIAVLALALLIANQRQHERLTWRPGLAATAGQWGLFLVVMMVATWAMSGARFAEMESAAAVISDTEAPAKSSSAGRVVVWRTAAALIADHPFGVGTGDVIPELMRLYERDGLDYASDRRLNPHNQWLQSGVAFGWPGILVLTMALLSAAASAWRQRDALAMLCVALVVMHAMVESVLEVQRGVVFILWMLILQLPASNRD